MGQALSSQVTQGEIIEAGPYIPIPNPDPQPNVMLTASRCLAGYYCTAGSSNQIICPPGYYCPEGSGAPIACAERTYCPQGSQTPQPCLAGHYCPAKSWAHLLCTEGYYCPINTASQLKCKAGTFCPEGSTFEKVCPAGSYCPTGTGEPVPCAEGNYCPATGLATQTPCPIGSYSTSGQSSCTPCMAPPHGRVEPATPGVPCRLVCDDGYVDVNWRCLPPWTLATIVDGVRSCPPCYSLNGSTCTLSLTCTPSCPDGYTLDQASKSCVPCPVGQYSLNGACVSCGPGSLSGLGERGCSCIQNSTIANSSVVWKAETNSCAIQCNGGYYRQTPTTCGICPANTYCPQGSIRPNPCPEATVSSTGSTSCKVEMDQELNECPAGTYSDDATRMCQMCPAGTYSSTVGATSSSTCLTCPSGTRSTMGSRSCT